MFARLHDKGTFDPGPAEREIESLPLHVMRIGPKQAFELSLNPRVPTSLHRLNNTPFILKKHVAILQVADCSSVLLQVIESFG